MSGRGHRKLRLCSRKYYEQKKKLVKDSTIVTSPSVVPDLQSLDVSLPISFFVNMDCSTLDSLRTRLTCPGAITQCNLFEYAFFND